MREMQIKLPEDCCCKHHADTLPAHQRQSLVLSWAHHQSATTGAAGAAAYNATCADAVEEVGLEPPQQ